MADDLNRDTGQDTIGESDEHIVGTAEDEAFDDDELDDEQEEDIEEQ